MAQDCEWHRKNNQRSHLEPQWPHQGNSQAIEGTPHHHSCNWWGRKTKRSKRLIDRWAVHYLSMQQARQFQFMEQDNKFMMGLIMNLHSLKRFLIQRRRLLIIQLTGEVEFHLTLIERERVCLIDWLIGERVYNIFGGNGCSCKQEQLQQQQYPWCQHPPSHDSWETSEGFCGRNGGSCWLQSSHRNITRFATTSEHFSHKLHDEWMPPFIHQGSITDEIPVTNQFCWTTGCKVIVLLIHSFFHVWQLYHMEVTALCHSWKSVSLTPSLCTPRMDRISNFKVDSHRNQDFLPLKLIQNSESLAPKKFHIQLRYGQFFGICLIWLVWSEGCEQSFGFCCIAASVSCWNHEFFLRVRSPAFWRSPILWSGEWTEILISKLTLTGTKTFFHWNWYKIRRAWPPKNFTFNWDMGNSSVSVWSGWFGVKDVNKAWI